MRTSLLAGSYTSASAPAEALVGLGRRRRILWIGVASVAAAAVVTLVILSRSSEPAQGHAHASIRDLDGASYKIATTSPDEIVTLHEGSIDVEVAPLHTGERFRVLLADAEVEVHGTAFVLTARAGHLINVSVRHGIVEVRPFSGHPRRLTAGEAWSARPPEITVAAPVDASPVPPTPTPNAPSEPRAADAVARAKLPRSEPIAPPSPPAPPAQRKPYEVAYADAWTSMQAGDFATAATAFMRVSLLDPDGPLAEDASFWNAVALERGKESTRAADAFRFFIDHFPRSPRIGEANTMLGWILVDARRPDEAARRFRAALTDPTPAIRESARAGLEALAK
ncbi:MAG: tetratricopeptide repeat protein [Deltaproteobacteria bacterium]|nr:tetratricopeptide repeat protein [Deltaproteobacteria bacterium]